MVLTIWVLVYGAIWRATERIDDIDSNTEQNPFYDPTYGVSSRINESVCTSAWWMCKPFRVQITRLPPRTLCPPSRISHLKYMNMTTDSDRRKLLCLPCINRLLFLIYSVLVPIGEDNFYFETRLLFGCRIDYLMQYFVIFIYLMLITN